MAGVFQNIDPPPPSPPGRTHLLGGEGVGVTILEHSSVLYVCKYFVRNMQ